MDDALILVEKASEGVELGVAVLSDLKELVVGDEGKHILGVKEYIDTQQGL